MSYVTLSACQRNLGSRLKLHTKDQLFDMLSIMHKKLHFEDLCFLFGCTISYHFHLSISTNQDSVGIWILEYLPKYEKSHFVN